MAATSSGERRQEYLVRSRWPRLPVEVLQSIEGNPSISIRRRIGDAGQPHTLLVTMSQLQAAALVQCFPGELVIEVDRPVM